MSLTATSRHEIMFPPATFNPKQVTIGGGGVVGSWLAVILAKLGVERITLADPQRVAIENIGSAAYGESHIGRNKADACADVVRRLSVGTQIRALDCRVEEMDDLGDVLFLCVDKMKPRKNILLKQCVPRKDTLLRVIETRMSLRFFMAHSLDPGSEHEVYEWLRYWFPDEDAVPIPGCGGHPGTVPTTAMMCASIAAELFMEWWAYKRCIHDRAANQFVYDFSDSREIRRTYW